MEERQKRHVIQNLLYTYIYSKDFDRDMFWGEPLHSLLEPLSLTIPAFKVITSIFNHSQVHEVLWFDSFTHLLLAWCLVKHLWIGDSCGSKYFTNIGWRCMRSRRLQPSLTHRDMHFFYQGKRTQMDMRFTSKHFKYVIFHTVFNCLRFTVHGWKLHRWLSFPSCPRPKNRSS